MNKMSSTWYYDGVNKEILTSSEAAVTQGNVKDLRQKNTKDSGEDNKDAHGRG